MPPHPEVPAALRRLRDKGFRLFTLTDNMLEIQGRQLEQGGVIDLFERRFSVRNGAAPSRRSTITASLPTARSPSRDSRRSTGRPTSPVNCAHPAG